MPNGVVMHRDARSRHQNMSSSALHDTAWGLQVSDAFCILMLPGSICSMIGAFVCCDKDLANTCATSCNIKIGNAFLHSQMIQIREAHSGQLWLNPEPGLQREALGRFALVPADVSLGELPFAQLLRKYISLVPRKRKGQVRQVIHVSYVLIWRQQGQDGEIGE